MNQRADKNNPLQNVSREEFILRRSKSVEFLLINIPLEKAVEKLLITLLTTTWKKRPDFFTWDFHKFPTAENQGYQQFSKHSI